jgi:hypothetical protein
VQTLPRGDRISTIFAESASERVSRSILLKPGSMEWAYRHDKRAEPRLPATAHRPVPSKVKASFASSQVIFSRILHRESDHAPQ